MSVAPVLEEVLAVLREEQETARRVGVELVGVVGSVARGDAGPDSDVDVVYDVIGRPTLFDLGGIVADLEERFESGADVTLEALRAKGLATRKGIPVKVLAKGEITKPLTVHANAFSAAARERIEAAGGTAQLLDA